MHSEECRKRIMEKVEETEEGKAMIEKAKDRLDHWTALQNPEEQLAQEGSDDKKKGEREHVTVQDLKVDGETFEQRMERLGIAKERVDLWKALKDEFVMVATGGKLWSTAIMRLLRNQQKAISTWTRMSVTESIHGKLMSPIQDMLNKMKMWYWRMPLWRSEKSEYNHQRNPDTYMRIY